MEKIPLSPRCEPSQCLLSLVQERPIHCFLSTCLPETTLEKHIEASVEKNKQAFIPAMQQILIFWQIHRSSAERYGSPEKTQTCRHDLRLH